MGFALGANNFEKVAIFLHRNACFFPYTGAFFIFASISEVLKIKYEFICFENFCEVTHTFSYLVSLIKCYHTVILNLNKTLYSSVALLTKITKINVFHSEKSRKPINTLCTFLEVSLVFILIELSTMCFIHPPFS